MGSGLRLVRAARPAALWPVPPSPCRFTLRHDLFESGAVVRCRSQCERRIQNRLGTRARCDCAQSGAPVVDCRRFDPEQACEVPHRSPHRLLKRAGLESCPCLTPDHRLTPRFVFRLRRSHCTEAGKRVRGIERAHSAGLERCCRRMVYGHPRIRTMDKGLARCRRDRGKGRQSTAAR